jgi:N-methylhydantoinase A/oxoprolinase/acetone carboxylase beta subunit
VTDADLVAGRMPVEGLAGLGRLDLAAARRALARAGATAAGGVDPARLALVAFGGAGPLHACALADALGMRAVVVPPRAGVLSAVGLLAAPRQTDMVRSWPDPADHRGAVAAAGRLAVSAGGPASGAAMEVSFDCRYAGQSHELTVSSPGRFVAEHARRNGFTLDRAVEVVAIRASARWVSPVDIGTLPVPDRSGPITGPAAIAEADCTIWVAPGWCATAHPVGSWLLTRVG